MPEPLSEYLDACGAHLARNFGPGVQAGCYMVCYRVVTNRVTLSAVQKVIA